MGQHKTLCVGACGARSLRDLNPGLEQQFAQLYSEALRQLRNCLERDVFDAALDVAHEDGAYAAAMREFLLREALALSFCTHNFAEKALRSRGFARHTAVF